MAKAKRLISKLQNRTSKADIMETMSIAKVKQGQI